MPRRFPLALLVGALAGCTPGGLPPPVMTGEIQGPLLSGTPIPVAPPAPPETTAAPPAGPVAPTPPTVSEANAAAPGASPAAAPTPPASATVAKAPERPKRPDRDPAFDRPKLPPAPPLPALVPEPGYEGSSFEILAAYDPTELILEGMRPEGDPGPRDPMAGVPETVRAWHGKKIGLVGYMIPVDFEENSVHTFMLARYAIGCCFGHVPALHEWVFVTMPPGKGATFAIVPVCVYGTLEIGRREGEGGGQAVYRMTGDKTVIPPW